MKAKKTKIDTLTKCYAVSPLTVDGKECMIVAAEKTDACNLYSLTGEKLSQIWDGPGGTMSIVPLKSDDGAFLATQKFYSPNDGAASYIVYVKPLDVANNKWLVKRILTLPFLHRFDVIERGGVRYLFLCTIKSDHKFRDDWSSPGKVLVGILPENLEEELSEADFKISVIKEGLTKNHGYTKDVENGTERAVVSTDNGVFIFTPPEKAGEKWGIEKIVEEGASDAIFSDLAGDGSKHLLVISPFHGDYIHIYANRNGKWEKVYEYPETAEFSHAITEGEVKGKRYIFIAHRKGKRRLLAFSYDKEAQKHTAEILDEDAGGANAALFKRDGKDILAVTNREIDEIALYELI